MQISQIIGGYTLGGADMLRRAMGKSPTRWPKHRETIADGARKKGYDPAWPSSLRLMTKFAEYGFNKVAHGRLCGGHYHTGVAEGLPPLGLHGRHHVLGPGQHR